MPIDIRDLTKSYDGKPVLADLTLTLPHPGVSVITGASGRGKTTFFRLLAGLETPDSGSIAGAGRVAYMFQEPRLLPWLSAAENVNLVLGDTPDTMPTALAWLARVELADAADKRPAALSGGMQQRVALARALAYAEAAQAETILLDEPFRALDRPLRLRLYPLLREAATRAAVVVVTHDLEDAELLGAKMIAL